MQKVRNTPKTVITIISLIAFLVLVLFLILLSLIQQKPPLKVKIAYVPFSSCLPFFVALENGYFEKRGINIEPIKTGSANEAINSLIAGKVDGTIIIATAVNNRLLLNFSSSQ